MDPGNPRVPGFACLSLSGGPLSGRPHRLLSRRHTGTGLRGAHLVAGPSYRARPVSPHRRRRGRDVPPARAATVSPPDSQARRITAARATAPVSIKLRVQADNALDPRLVAATRGRDPAIDVQTAPALGVPGRGPEARGLPLPADEGRLPVTPARSTMPAEVARFSAPRPCPGGRIGSRTLTMATAAEWLQLLWAASEAEESLTSLYRLP